MEWERFGGTAWLKVLTLISIALASGDTYDSVMGIQNAKKRRIISAVILLSPAAVLFSLIFSVTYPLCEGSINGRVMGLYLAKGLASYLYCARADLVLTATMQKVTKCNLLVLNGLKVFAVFTVVFSCSKALFVYKNVVLPNGKCIADTGGSFWGASDEILFMILDVGTCFMLYNFYRQFQEVSESGSTGKSNVKRVLGRILRLSVISVSATIFAIVMQFQDPGQIEYAGTVDVCTSVITLTLVFNKPQKNSARASIAGRKRSSKAAKIAPEN